MTPTKAEAKPLRVKAVIFPDGWPIEDQQAVWVALAHPGSFMASVVLNKCYIFAWQMYGDENDLSVYGWLGDSPLILEARP